MIKQYYSVYDKKSQTYSQPFLEITDGTAQRAIQDLLLGDKDHPFTKHTSDFAVYKLGSFNDETGSIVNNKPELLTELTKLSGE